MQGGEHARGGRKMAALALAMVGLALGCGDPEALDPPLEPDAALCGSGFDTVGDECVDIDECAADPGPCDARTTCINLRGGFSCGACPEGYVGDGLVDGEGCTLDCPPGQADGGGGRCAPRGTCNPGYEPGPDGGCAPLQCPPDQHFDGAEGCVPLGECAPGFAPDDAGDCVAGPCPAGEHDDGTGACAPEGECAEGYRLDAAGDCAPLPECPEGEHPIGDGSCGPAGTCVDGYALDAQGDCRPLSCPEDDPREPDDTPAEADPLTPDEAVIGVACPDDPDHFALDPGARCRVVAALTAVGSEPLEAALTLVDEGGRLLTDAPGGEARLEVAGPLFAAVAGAGLYRLQVRFEGHDGGDGACVELGVCSPGYAEDDAGACTRCAAGFRDGGGGACVPLGACAPGFALDLDGSCRQTAACPPGARDDGAGDCAPDGDPCAPGFGDDGAGGCAPPGVCAAGFVLDVLDRCRMATACPVGERDTGDGACGGPCASGYHGGGGEPGICLPAGDCAPGWVERGDGTCDRACLGGLERAGAVCVEDFTCPADDGTEVDEPRELSPGASKYGVVCPGDADRFRLAPPTGCGVRFILRFDPAEGPLVLEVGAEAAPATGRDAPEGQRLVVEGVVGPLAVRVRGADDEAGARYALRVDLDGHDGGDGTCQPLGACAVGYALAADDSGACDRCAPGFEDGDGGAPGVVCVPEGDCAEGFHDGGDGVCVPDDRCAPGFADGDGDRPGIVCVPEGTCAAGFHDGGDGGCVPVDACAEGFHDGDGAGPGTVCVPEGACSAGFHDGGDGGCVARGDCAEGFHDGDGAGPGDRCLPTGACLRGWHDGGDGVCVERGLCREGYLDRGDGVCVENLLFGTVCAPGRGFAFEDGGVCVCNEGTRDGGDGRCVPEGACSPGFRPDAPETDDQGEAPACAPVGICAAGHHSTPWGACRPTAACPAGERDDGIGACVPEVAGCADGFAVRGEVCAAPPACGPGHHDAGDGTCAPIGGCADGFRPSAAGCVPQGPCSPPSDFAAGPPIEVGPPVAGVACGPDVWRFDTPRGCGVEARLVADPAAGAVDLELFDADEALVARVEALDGTARLWLPPGEPRQLHLRVTPYPPGAVDPVPYRLALVADPLRCMAVCPFDQRPDGGGRCVDFEADCAPGWHEGGDGACVPLDRCTPGFHDGGDGVCVPFDVCRPGYRLTAELTCAAVTADCPPGERDNGGGVCALTCAVGQGYHEGGDGTCVATPYCVAGYADDGGGLCVARTPEAECAPDVFEARPDGDGLCLLVRCTDLDDDTDALAEALPLDVRPGEPTVVYGSLCLADPGDWYRVGGGHLRARLRFDHADGDLRLRFLDANGLELAAADSADDDEVLGLPGAPAEVIVEVTGESSVGYRLDLVRD